MLPGSWSCLRRRSPIRHGMQSPRSTASKKRSRDLNHESSPTRIVRIAVASSYIDRLPQCRPALWRVVQDGRAGGAVTMSIQALALLGFDAFLTGQWDSLAEMADESVSLCDTHSYGLLRWPARSLQALLAAARGDSANARAIADEVIGWAVPRRAGAMHVYVSACPSARRDRTRRLRERVPKRLCHQPRWDHRVARSACDVDGAGPRRGSDAYRPQGRGRRPCRSSAGNGSACDLVTARSDHVWRWGDGCDRRQ